MCSWNAKEAEKLDDIIKKLKKSQRQSLDKMKREFKEVHAENKNKIDKLDSSRDKRKLRLKWFRGCSRMIGSKTVKQKFCIFSTGHGQIKKSDESRSLLNTKITKAKLSTGLMRSSKLRRVLVGVVWLYQVVDLTCTFCLACIKIVLLTGKVSGDS